MTTTRVAIRNEVEDGPRNTWRLCFHFATYRYGDGRIEDGYRFIWRRPDNSLHTARAQARIPDSAALNRLLKAAKAAGWYK